MPDELLKTDTPADLADWRDEVARLECEYESTLSLLTEQRRRFVSAYLLCGVGLTAAKQAGYAPDTAGIEGTRLLNDASVSKCINLARRAAAIRRKVKVDDILCELQIIAYSDITDYLTFDKDGMPIKQAGREHLWRAVQQVTRRLVPRKDGDPEIHTTVKLWPKVDALRLLGAYTGILAGEGADERQNTPTVVVVGLDTDAIAGKAPPRLAARADVVDVEPTN